ncbi:hypothetical protein EsH8_V_000887 [Colletotrichum jinshuiense]
MSHLQYFAYPGYGEKSKEDLHYSQAVRVDYGLTAIGGWVPETSKIPTEINAQIDQAFANVELTLKNAGGKGWSQVYRVNSYHLPMNDEALNAVVRNFRKYMPDHQPIWTAIGVARLGFDDMRVEIEVVAHVDA